MNTPINIERYGRWTLIRRVENTVHGSKQYLCLCECGTKKVIRLSSLRNGDSKSCGCLLIDSNVSRATHGMSNTKVYRTWRGIKDRCTNPNNKDYKYYGARGITYDLNWNTFEQFYKDIGNPPTETHELDRIDNNKGYSKDNCRWTNHYVQMQNRRIYLERMINIVCPMCKAQQKMEYETTIKNFIPIPPFCCEVMRNTDTKAWNDLLDKAIEDREQSWKNKPLQSLPV